MTKKTLLSYDGKIDKWDYDFEGKANAIEAIKTVIDEQLLKIKSDEKLDVEITIDQDKGMVKLYFQRKKK